MRSDGCWRPGRIGLVIAMTLLSACATGGSGRGGAVCPPVVNYPTGVQQRAAEVEALPQDSAISAMMADYHVLRQQARVCG